MKNVLGSFQVTYAMEVTKHELIVYLYTWRLHFVLVAYERLTSPNHLNHYRRKKPCVSAQVNYKY